MAVIDGYKKVKNYILTSKGYQLLSRWTHASTVECEDGKTVQTKVGAIDGITDSLNSTSSTTALSAKAGNQLNSDLGTKPDGYTTVWTNIKSLTDSYTSLKKSVVDGKQQLLNTINKYWNLSNNGWTNSAENTNFGNLSDMITLCYNAGYNKGGSGKHTLSSQTQSKTYSYTGGEYGDETVTLTFTKNVAGVLSYTNNQSAAYLFPVSISVYNNTVTFRMGHYHGTSHIGTSATLSVTAYVMD